MVRHGTEQDIEACLDMSQDFYAFTRYSKIIPLCRASCEEYIRAGIEQKMLSVAEKEGEVIGFILGLGVPHLMNKNYLIGSEIAWWVKPEHRNTSAGIKLVDHLEKSAKELGCHMMLMICLEDLAPERLEKLYLSRGYDAAERVFVREL